MAYARILFLAFLAWTTCLPLHGQQPDSVQKKKPVVVPGLFEYHPTGASHRDSIGLPTPEEGSILDPEWRADGFSYNLGQFFKPFRTIRFGIQDQWDTQQSFFSDPLTGRPDPYAVDDRHGIRFFDTRTPYANVQFTQGKQKLQLLDVTASQNISPFLNISAGFRRRQHIGAYLSNTTDHYNIWLSVNAHTRDGRTWLFASGWFNQLADQMNGGVQQDGGLPFEALFNKNAQRVNLSDLRWRRFGKGLSIFPVYQMPLSDGWLKLGVQSSATEWLRRINSSAFAMASNIYPVPLSPGTDTSSFEDKSGLFSFRNTAYMGLNITPLPGWKLQMDVMTGLDRQQVSFGTLDILQHQPFATLDAGISRNGTELTLHGNMRRPSLFPSSDRMLGFTARQRVWDAGRNTLWATTSGAGRTALPSLQQWYQDALHIPAHISLVQAGLEWQLSPGDSSRFALRTGIEGFGSRQRDLPLCDSLGNWWQAPVILTDLGLVHSLELQLGPWALRHALTFHRPSVDGNAPYLYQGWKNSFPGLHGTGGLFFTVRDKRWVKYLEAGGEVRWFTQYTPPALDVRTGDLFYQAWADAPGFTRIDGILRFQVRRAVVHFRSTNLLEGLLLPGNYLLPFYPAQERALYFGVNWTFFD